MFLVSLLKNILHIVSKNKIVFLLFLIIIFLRFYNLEKFTVFLSDQGRDAIIIKRIAMLQDFPLIGAPTSIGQVFLGPFYYYLIAPFLLAFQLNPIGMTFGVAFLSVAGILVSYLAVKKEINKTVAFLFAFLIAFSLVQIEFARFSWNPNLLPIFAFLTLYFFYKSLITKKTLHALAFGASLALSIQLHYLAILIFIPLLVVFTEVFLKNKSKKLLIKNVFLSIGSFILFFSPLILFDLRHGFLNSNNFIKLFTKKDLVSESSLISRFLETNQAFFSQIFKLDLNPNLAVILLSVLIFGFLIVKKNKMNLLIKLNFYAVFFYIIGFSFLTSARHPHYFASIHYSLFLVLAYMMGTLSKRQIFKYLIVPVFIIFYLFTNVKSYSYFQKTDDWTQIKHSKKVAGFMVDKINGKPFNIATWPIAFGEDNYLYFLELKGLIPADRAKTEVTEQMFVLCNEEPCLVLNSPSWNISMFGKSKIDKIWEIEGVKIYRLLHEK